MSERGFRAIQGLYLLSALYFEAIPLLYAFMVLTAVEGLTNLRVPLVISRLRFGKAALATNTEDNSYKYKFEAERLIRLTVLSLLIVAVLVVPDTLWFLPWFVGAMLFMAGVSNICPMAIFYHWLGFR